MFRGVEEKYEDGVFISYKELKPLITCPVYHTVFFDPVTINGCGHAIEREAAYQCVVCPICRQFDPVQVTPSPLISNLVDTALQKYPELLPERYFSLRALNSAQFHKDQPKLEKLIAILKVTDYLNKISEEPGFVGGTALTQLLNSLAGIDAFMGDETLVKMVTAEGINAIFQEGIYAGMSFVYLMACHGQTLHFLKKHPEIIQQINATTLNCIRPTGPYAGASPLLWMLIFDVGRQILLEHDFLCELIDINTLSTCISSGEFAGKSAYHYLRETEEGKILLQKHPRLQSQMDFIQSKNTLRLFKPPPTTKAPIVRTEDETSHCGYFAGCRIS